MRPEQTNSLNAELGFPPDLLVSLDRSSGRGLREQLEGELRRAVRAGRLAIGTALPPSRVLARELGVARSVVVDAYGQLAAEGYLEARQGSGTRVARDPPEGVTGDGGPRRRPEPGPRLLGGLPDPASFPRRQWQRHYRAAIGALSTSSLPYPDPRGERTLRAALAAYLGRVRAVVTARHVQVCGGFTQGLALVCRALRAQGARRLAVEDPCFSYHRELIANAGLEPVPVAVDANGIDVRALAASDVAAVLVAPAHSYPTGAVLAPQRRVELSEWARATDALIIEDDYDAEFRYDRAPIGALQGLRPERIVYGGSVSKTLSPILRVGWLAGPEWLMPTCGARSSTTTSRPARSTSSRSATSSRAATSPGTCAACGPSTGAGATPPSVRSPSTCPTRRPTAWPRGCTSTSAAGRNATSARSSRGAPARRPARGRRPPLGRLRRRAARARHRLRDGGGAGDRAGDPGAGNGVRDHHPGRSGDERRRLKTASAASRGGPSARAPGGRAARGGT